MKRISNFGTFAFGTLVSPNKTFDRVLAEPFPLGYGLSAVLFTGVLYTITVGFGYLNGFGAVARPWVPIPADEYYAYQALFTIPVFIISTILFSGAVQTLSAFFGGQGNFENCIAVAGFGLWITIIPLMWIPETITMAFLPQLRTSELGGTLGLPLGLEWARQLLTFLWQIIVTLVGVRQVQRLPWSKTLFIGLVGYFCYFAVFWTYIR